MPASLRCLPTKPRSLASRWKSEKRATPVKPVSWTLDPIPTYKVNDEEEHVFSGKRIGRRNRLYRTKDGREICADVNGAYNILGKSRPDAFDAKGIAGYVVHPVRLSV